MGVDKVNKSIKVDLKEGLKSIFPEVFEDNKINFEKLKGLLSDDVVEKEDDRFYFNWAGKSTIFKFIQAPAYGTLKPDKEKSIDFENTENIAIIGENLETLKLLLKPYFEKVKMIYIDPPYNTGKDFIYNDNFKEPMRDYLEKTGQIDVEGNKLTTNTEASGRYHSDWLNFIYPRLFLARSLLRDDGVIFVSIDDHEVHHLRMIMDEIFGEENFVDQIIRKTKSFDRDKSSKEFQKIYDSILVYSKDENLFKMKQIITGIREYPFCDKYGNYKLNPLQNKGPHGYRVQRPKTYYPIYVSTTGEINLEKKSEEDIEVFPEKIGSKDGTWSWSKQKLINEKNRVVFKNNTLFIKIYEDKNKDSNKYVSEQNMQLNFLNSSGSAELRSLGLQGLFDNPKPVELLKWCINLSTNSSDLILDFFAGSGTTGQAVWDLNKEDGGNRKFILVQLDEKVQDEEIKKEFPTVADICIERLRRVSEKYRKEDNNHDFGFKIFRLDKSNFNLKDEFEIPADKSAEDIKQKYLNWLGLWIDQPLVDGWKNIDVVYEVILKEGLNLNSKIEEVKIKNNNFYYVQDVEQGLDFYISLDEKIDKETIEEIRTAKYKNKMFVLNDSALTDDDKINLTSSVRFKVI